MKRPFTRLEKKQLLIFALIAFGIPYLMGIPMAFGYQRGTSLDRKSTRLNSSHRL